MSETSPLRRRDRALAAAAPYASVGRMALDQLSSNRLARLGAYVLAFLAVIAIVADLIASELPIACRLHGHLYLLPNITRPAALEGYDRDRIEGERSPGDWAVYTPLRFGPRQVRAGDDAGALSPPSWRTGHLLGTDGHGQDVLARLIHGTRTSLGLGLVAVAAFAGIGVFVGGLAGFFGGVVDALVARVVETVTAFPVLVLVLVVQALLPHPTAYSLLAIIGLTRWTEVARLVRAEVLAASELDYTTAARALGASPWRVLFRHVMPNAIAPALVAATFGVASVVLIETKHDFMRVGAPGTVASWGQVMSEARGHPEAWWLLLFPGVLVFVTVAALNVIGEALRDALDPRLRNASARAPDKPGEP